MALDGGMLACVAWELRETLLDGKVEKVLQPERDEVHLLIRSGRESHRLMLSASSGSPRVSLTEIVKENPASPPMFCMLLRKHLTGGQLRAVDHPAFERILFFEFETKGELGECGKRTLIVELMGRYTNIILCDTHMKVLSALRYSDLSASCKRPLLPGLPYELPPDQGKKNPLDATRESFLQAISALSPETPADKALFALYRGFCPAAAAELAYRAKAQTVKDADTLWEVFARHMDIIRSHAFSPCILVRTLDDKPFAYSYFPLTHFSSEARIIPYDSPSQLLEEYHGKRENEQRKAQKSVDITRLLKNAKSRLHKKIFVQEEELADTAGAISCKKAGELIFQELYRLKKGDHTLVAIDYETGETITVKLDPRYPPAVNANQYYKDYNRKKNAKEKLSEQLEQARRELQYIDTVLDALTRAKTEADLAQIREELSHWDYGGKQGHHARKKQKLRPHPPIKLQTPSGYTLMVGKNNLQNDELTTHIADKNDWWFHVKDYPGSHVIMITGGEEPPIEDFTFAAQTAAVYSSAGAGAKVAVDYTKIRHIKKPAGSRPGYVTYDPYWTAYVSKGDSL